MNHTTFTGQDALESMLSKKSLVKDQFLASKMNPQMCAIGQKYSDEVFVMMRCNVFEVHSDFCFASA